MTTSNGTTTDYYTSNSYYVLLLTDITDSPCDQITITVSGYNGLNGEDESIPGIYLPKGRSSSSSKHSPNEEFNVYYNFYSSLKRKFDFSESSHQ